MIRRPPTAIPLKQDDVADMEAFLALRRAAMEAAEQNEAMDVEEQQQQNGKGKGKGKAGGNKGKGKGKQRSEQQGLDDSLVEAEEEARVAREAQSRDQRIGV